MKITYVSFPGLTDGVLSCITEDKQQAIEHCGSAGSIVRIVTHGESVQMCAVFRGEAEFPWL